MISHFCLFSIAFIVYLTKVSALINPGLDNPYYLIESYYGSRNQEYYSSQVILNDEPTTFQWCTNYDYDATKGRVYFANRIRHTIQYRDLSTDEIVTVAGIDGVSGQRDGDFTNTLFNSPTALKIFRYDKEKAQRAREKKIIILNSDSIECQYVTYYNYTSCNSLSINDDITIDPARIKEIFPNFDNNLVTDEDLALEQLSGTILFVMDRENSCIRKLDLTKGISSTFAGTCGTSGFKDGPPEVNLFNGPDSFGIDDLGNLFVLDAQNTYIRLISQDGFTNTLIKGACRAANQQTGSQIVEALQTRYVTCYRKWIKTSGVPASHIFTDLTSLEKCFRNDVMCGGKNRSHPLLYINSTFRGSFNSTTDATEL